MSNGYNPIRHDCAKNGCWNKIYRPKIEVFAECFPGLINFGDIDGPDAQTAIVEINSRTLMLEWKSSESDMRRGQDLLYKNTTALGFNVVCVVVGNAQTMEIKSLGWYIDGQFLGWRKADLDSVKKAFSKWAIRVKALNPIHRRDPREMESLNDKPVADYEKCWGEHDAWIVEYTAEEVMRWQSNAQGWHE